MSVSSSWPADPICSFVAATNIETVIGVNSSWSCNFDGEPVTDPCTWTRLKCNTQLNISELIMAGTSLIGTLPPNLGSITTITAMYIVGSNISGTLPSSWDSLTGLSILELKSNFLSGSLPHSWSSLKTLTILSLQANQLTGALPASWGNLTIINDLTLTSNFFTGCIPGSWNQLRSLTLLGLNGNQLTGTIPQTLGLLRKLEEVVLANNCLTGSLPASFEVLTLLTFLALGSNSLTGTLPSEWGSNTALVDVYLSPNELSGSLPSSWASLMQLGYLQLAANSFTGTLPPSWGTLTSLYTLTLSSNFFTGSLPTSWHSLNFNGSLYLSGNSLTGTLPPSWGSFTTLIYLYLDSNSLTGSIPLKWGSLETLYELQLGSNSFTSSVPATIGSLTALRVLQLDSNFLSGAVPYSLGLLSQVVFLQLNGNQFSGSLSFSNSWDFPALVNLDLSDNAFSGVLVLNWSLVPSIQNFYISGNYLIGSFPNLENQVKQLRVFDASDNLLTGSLPPYASAYPVYLNSLNVAYNMLNGSIPSALAQFGNISYFNVSTTSIDGSIPSEFCSSAGIDIDVYRTGISCYSGCLTSSFVLVTGASPECHNGSIMEHFILVSSVCAAVAVGFTFLRHVYSIWAPVTRTCENCVAAVVTAVSDFVALFVAWVVSIYKGKSEPNDQQSSKSNLLFWITLAKFAFALLVSLLLNNWWTYSGGLSLERNSQILASCSSKTVGNCYSFCGDIDVIVINILDDDLALVDDVYDPTGTVSVPHTQTTSYCVAQLNGSCGYQFWLDFKLAPIVFQIVTLVLQIFLWQFGSGEFTSSPQDSQYDQIIDHLHPHIRDAMVDARNDTPVTLASRLELIKRLATPLSPCVFWFLELVTVVYVWGELLFPPVFCDAVRPLSLYYYPILMCLFDLMKLNVYCAIELWKAKRYVQGMLALLDLQLFATHFWMTVVLGALFLGALVREFVGGLCWCMILLMGRREPIFWPGPYQESGNVTPGINGIEIGSGSAIGNPMISDANEVDVEMSNVAAVSVVLVPNI